MRSVVKHPRVRDRPGAHSLPFVFCAQELASSDLVSLFTVRRELIGGVVTTVSFICLLCAFSPAVKGIYHYWTYVFCFLPQETQAIGGYTQVVVFAAGEDGHSSIGN